MKKITLLAASFALGLFTAKAQFTSVSKDQTAFQQTKIAPPSYFETGQSLELKQTGPDDASVYRKKSRTNMTIGLVLLGTGLVSGVVGVLVANDNDINSDNGSAAATLFIISAVTGAASIPFMAMAMSNHHKAKAAMKNEKTGWGMPPGKSRDLYGLSLSLPLSR